MTGMLIPRRTFQAALFCFALFVPFSIAGMTIAFGFAALAWLIMYAAGWVSGENRGRDAFALLRDPLFLSALLLVISAIPSVLISDNVSRAVNDWASYWEFLILFLVAGNALRLGMREVAFWALVASASLSAVVGIIQRAGGMDFAFIHIGAQYRVSSTLYTMTFAGILYQLIVFDFSVLQTRAMRARAKLLLCGALALLFTAILLTMTRGAWLALAAGLVTAALLMRGRVALLVGALVVALMGVAFIGSTVQKGRSIPDLVRSGLDVDASTRVVLWDISWQLFKEHPLAGVGMGDYTTEANKLLRGRKVTTTVDTHDVYLHILATRGLVGFIPFVLFWVVLFRRLFQMRRALPRGSLSHQYAVGAIAACVAVLVGALTELNIDDGEVFMAFTFLTGLALSGWYTPVSGEVAEVGGGAGGAALEK